MCWPCKAQHAGSGEDVLDTIHDGSYQPALITFLLQQDSFLREQHGILCVRVSCVSCATSARDAAGDEHLHLWFSHWVLCKIVYTLQCLCYGEEWEKTFMPWKLRVCHYLINHIQVTAADIIPGQLFFVTGSIWHYYEACVQAEGRHFEHLLWLVVIMYSIFSLLTSPHHMNRSTKKRVLWNDYCKMLQRTEFDLFHCKQRNYLTVYVKTNCFHFVKFDNHNNKSYKC
jgi:hypothetical protein